MSRKAFTVDEANHLIPRLERVVSELHQLRGALQEHSEQLQILDVMWGDALERVSNPDHRSFVEHRTAMQDTIARIEEQIRDEVASLGVRFPVGGLEHGLLDFPTTYQGRWIYLCWKLGEDAITHWNEMDSGFAGRQPL